MKKDPTAFYSVDEYKHGCEVLKQFCDRRAKSIRMQLDGKQDNVDASDLSVVDMGAFIDREEE